MGDLCKQYLRLKHPGDLAQVEEFILEIEGPGKNRDGSKWDMYIDLHGITEEVLKRLDVEFERRLGQ